MTIKSLLRFSGIILPLLFLASISMSMSPSKKKPMVVKSVSFGKIKVNGKLYEHDIKIDGTEVSKRSKKASKPFKSEYGHTPLTHLEDIPWDCDTLVIGKGMSGRLPITDEFKEMAKEKGVKLIIKKTPEAAKYYSDHWNENTNAVFHVTC